MSRNEASPSPVVSWFKAHRSPEALELIKANPKAFILLYVIAYRARWHDGFNADGLAPGEAMLGDFEEYGMSEREYRTAKMHLAKWKFTTFRKTNRGTIGRIIDTRVFSVLNEPNDGQKDRRLTDSRRAVDGQPTTNSEGVEGKDRKEGARATAAPLPLKSTIGPKLSGAEIVNLDNERKKIAQRIKRAYAQAPIDAMGKKFFSPEQKEMLETDRAREREIEECLGWKHKRAQKPNPRNIGIGITPADQTAAIEAELERRKAAPKEPSTHPAKTQTPTEPQADPYAPEKVEARRLELERFKETLK